LVRVDGGAGVENAADRLPSFELLSGIHEARLFQ